MSGEPYTEKLVRDLIPRIIEADGRTPQLRQVDDQVAAPFAHRKVLEEAAELYDALRSGKIEDVRAELADLLEIMRRTAHLAGVPWNDVEATRIARAEARGGFEANYLLGSLPSDLRRVYGAGDPPLFRALDQHLRNCRRASIAVSFGMRSGVEMLGASIAAALRNGSTIRLLTSDYLDITEPEALEELLALGEGLDLRLYHEPGRSFHAKCYIFEQEDGRNAAFVGSSNLSRSALDNGIEWNYLVRETDDGWSLTDLLRRFDALFTSPYSRPVTQAEIDAYRARRRPRVMADERGPSKGECPTPNAPQREALAELESLRAQGERKALVVAATGIGKTYLAAFDSQPFPRVLFLAHREELLDQAQRTFAQVRPDARMGFYGGGRHDLDADILFASVSTLGRTEHLARFAPDRFDYIVVDEFHHAAARSYLAVLHYFAPRFLLGLTATPYRGDNRDVFALCDGNVAYRVTFMEAIGLGWLCPFRYHGIYDETDYAAIPWRNGRYDAEALSQVVGTRERAHATLEAYRQHPSRAAVGFCVSIAHAEFMADYFTAHGVPSLAVHSGPGAPDRAEAIAAFRRGDVQVLFTVDLFNEGVDVPEIDLVLFLRPTESVTIFLQQLGRGLRLCPGKEYLTVLDFIGNYRRAHYKVPLILGKLDEEPDPATLRKTVEEFVAGATALPPGVEVHFCLRAIDLIRDMAARGEPRRQRLMGAYEEVVASLGHPPTMLELQRWGRYDVRLYRQEFGSWNRFREVVGAMSLEDRRLDEEAGELLAELEKTPMTKSYKMVVLQAFLRLGGLDAPVSLDALIAAFRSFFLGSARHGQDLEGTEIAAIAEVSDVQLRTYLLKNPLAAWTNAGGKGERKVYFALDEAAGTFAYVGPPATDLARLEAAMRERAEFRLAEYFEVRFERRNVFNVINAGEDKGIIMLGSDERAPIPRGQGWVAVRINGKALWAKFAKIAINVLKERPDDGAGEPNILTQELEAMFGPGGFLPQRGNKVRIGPAAADSATWEILPYRSTREGSAP